MNRKSAEDMNVLTLRKGKEYYLFTYKDAQRADVLRQLGRCASNPELSFTWFDAARLSQVIRKQERSKQGEL